MQKYLKYGVDSKVAKNNRTIATTNSSNNLEDNMDDDYCIASFFFRNAYHSMIQAAAA